MTAATGHDTTLHTFNKILKFKGNIIKSGMSRVCIVQPSANAYQGNTIHIARNTSIGEMGGGWY